VAGFVPVALRALSEALLDFVQAIESPHDFLRPWGLGIRVAPQGAVNILSAGDFRPCGKRQNPMYAVIKTGGKQYRVAKDEVLSVEKLDGEKSGKLEFTEVLMVGGDGKPKVGTPTVSGAKVTAEIVEQTRGPKIIVFKKRRRKNSRRKRGHRQDLTTIRITGISA
jgi:large subunit ribosomal protein L21